MLRPTYHYRPAHNWINDPNGLCQADGWYHLFYQHNPGGSVWGDMHWGHARSRDMARWEDMPIAMAPLREAGEEHCFSGCCCRDEQGGLRFFYTSIGRDADGRGVRDGAEQWTASPTDGSLTTLRQTQSGALTDAIHGGMHAADWRDPYVVRHGSGWLMVLGGCVAGRGCMLIYDSADMAAWRYRGIIAQADQADGVPWECPNLFPLGDKWVLFFSPCDAPRYRVGTLDDDLHFHIEHEGVLDPGGNRGFYAPQAFRDEAGQTILLGWMPESDGDGALRRGWSGVMSLPRLLSLDERGDLSAEPLPSLTCLRGVGVGRRVMGDKLLTRRGRCAMLTLRTTLSAGQRMTLCLRCDEPRGEETRLTLTAEGELTLESVGTSPDKAIIRRDVPMAGGEAAVFVALDNSTVECAVNGRWLSGRTYPSNAATALWLSTDAACEVRLWDDIL